MLLRERLNSYIGEKIALTGTEIGKLCSLWVEHLQEDLLCGYGMIEFEEHPCIDERYQNDVTEWTSVSDIWFDIENGMLTRIEPGIELYPDPGRWELDPEHAWNDEDVEAAITFLDYITGKKELDKSLVTEEKGVQKEQVGLCKECKDLEFIINNLATGKETCEMDPQYTFEEAIEYLRDYLQGLRDLSNQLIEFGNTPELLKKVHDKYTELWLFQVYCTVDSLPRVIGRLWRYPNCDEYEP